MPAHRFSTRTSTRAAAALPPSGKVDRTGQTNRRTLEERYESSDEDEFEVERWETRDFQVREIAPRT
jgi:hypothetical protein